jgi:hypothetical protein
MINTKKIFFSLVLSASALALFLKMGVVPQANPVRPNEYIIDRDALTVDDWQSLFRRQDIIFVCFSFAFATSGSTLILPSDFSTTNNIISVISAGGPGQSGSTYVPPGPPPGSGCPGGDGGGCAGGCTPASGGGGWGGGGGGTAQKFNYNLHAAGQSVPILFQLGQSGQTWFHSVTTLQVQNGGWDAAGGGGPGNRGAAASSSVNNAFFPGSDGLKPVNSVSGEHAAGGGGAGGKCGGPTSYGGSPGAGNGGAGSPTTVDPGLPGSQYGGGGGGGYGDAGGTVTAGGAAYQGLIAIQYLSTNSRYFFFPRMF